MKNKLKWVTILFTILAISTTFSLATDTTSAPNNATQTSTTTTEPEQNTTQTPTDTTAPDTTTPSDNPDSTTEEPDSSLTQETYNGDLYLTGNTVVMDKLVDGNVYIVGSDVTISGKINGNLFVFANKLNIQKGAYAINSMYLFANELDMSGAATDLYIFVTNNMTMQYDAFAKRDARIYATNLTFKGAIGRDAFIKSSNFELVGGEEGAQIFRNLKYASSKQIEIPEGVVSGQVDFVPTNTSGKSELSIGEILTTYLLDLVSTIVFTCLAFLLIHWIAPNFTKKAKEYVGVKTIFSFLIGLGGIFLLPVVLLLAVFTVILIPVSIAGFAIWGLLLAFSFAIVVSLIVNKFNRNQDGTRNIGKTILFFLVTTISLWILQQIPYLSIIVSLAISSIGFGTPIFYLFTRNSTPKSNPVK